MIDIISYILGLVRGKSTVVLDSSAYTFTDSSNDGNIVITETEG